MSDAGARPPGFSLRDRYSWIDCHLTEYAGLTVEVRTSLSNGERADFLEALDRINAGIDAEVKQYQARSAAIAKTITEASDTAAYTAAIRKQRKLLDDQSANAEKRRRERLTLIAGYVRAWNVLDNNNDDVPPPSVDIDAALSWTDDTIIDWLINTCVNGYKSGKGLRTRSLASKPTPEPTSEPLPESEAEPST